MKFGSLFTGIGGIDLGLECSGMTCEWQVENNPFCVKVLEKHWPSVKRYGDIKEIKWEEIKPVDLICGGFPCQPVSVAGRQKGQKDSRWLWPEFARAIRRLQPRWVLVENVLGLRYVSGGKAFAEILQDLARYGYDAEWANIPATSFGAPHLRYRIFIVAYRQEFVRTLAHTDTEGLQRRIIFTERPNKPSSRQRSLVCNTAGTGLPYWSQGEVGQPAPLTEFERSGGREIERDFRGVAHGVPAELDLIRRIIGEQGDIEKENTAKRKLVWKVLRTVWENRKLAKTSPKLYRDCLHNLVPEMSYARTQERWLLGTWIEKDEELYNLWKHIYASPFQKAQNLFPDLLKRIGKKKRPKALGSREDRLRALGNAVVPQVAEWVGSQIMRVENSLELDSGISKSEKAKLGNTRGIV